MEANGTEKLSARDLILKTVREKACMKQDVYDNTLEQFRLFKEVMKEIVSGFSEEIQCIDNRIGIEYRDKGKFAAEMKFAGDMLIFQMHTNVFHFDRSHQIWQTSYVKEDPSRAYCGMINIYNFLSDSFKYNRVHDSGYLVARIFINRDKHYFVEGKRQLGYLYNDFVNGEITRDKITSIVESAILFSLDFDLLTPAYDHMKEATVHELQAFQQEMRLRTGKRLGYRFQADDDFV